MSEHSSDGRAKSAGESIIRKSVLKRGVLDLDINMWVSPYRKKVHYSVPSLVFKSETLVKLRLSCLNKIKIPQDVYLPMLRTLWVEHVRLGEDHDDGYETLLSRCPVLEELELQQLLGVDQAFNVSSPCLKKLCLLRFYSVNSMTLDVPNLVYFEYSCTLGEMYPKVAEGHIIRDGTMSLLNAIKVLHLSSDHYEVQYAKARPYHEAGVFILA